MQGWIPRKYPQEIESNQYDVHLSLEESLMRRWGEQHRLLGWADFLSIHGLPCMAVWTSWDRRILIANGRSVKGAALNTTESTTRPNPYELRYELRQRTLTRTRCLRETRGRQVATSNERPIRVQLQDPTGDLAADPFVNGLF